MKTQTEATMTVPVAIAGDRVRGGRIIACADAAWHSQQLEEPCILENPKDPSRLLMFYSGVPSSNTSVCHIGKAWALKSDPFTWHQDPYEPRVEHFWPEKDGEWYTVRRGTPRFPGHDMPRIPLLGWQDEADPKVMRQHVELARRAAAGRPRGGRRSAAANGDRLQPVQRLSRRAEEFDLPKSVCDYALLVYSDFNYRDTEDRPRKTILVREIVAASER